VRISEKDLRMLIREELQLELKYPGTDTEFDPTFGVRDAVAAVRGAASKVGALGVTTGDVAMTAVAGSLTIPYTAVIRALYELAKSRRINSIAVYGFTKYLLGDDSPLTFRDFAERGYTSELKRICETSLTAGYRMDYHGKEIAFGTIGYGTHDTGDLASTWVRSVTGTGQLRDDLAVCLGEAGASGGIICAEGGKPGYGNSTALLAPQSRELTGGSRSWRINNEFDFSRLTDDQMKQGFASVVKLYTADLRDHMGSAGDAVSYLIGRLINLTALPVIGGGPSPFWMDIEFPDSGFEIDIGTLTQSVSGTGCGGAAVADI